jgi:hypothetical protein
MRDRACARSLASEWAAECKLAALPAWLNPRADSAGFDAESSAPPPPSRFDHRDGACVWLVFNGARSPAGAGSRDPGAVAHFGPSRRGGRETFSSAAHPPPDRAGGLLMKTLVLANQKGGVGKSAVATLMSHCFAQHGQRVLAIDFDHQGNFSGSMRRSSRVQDAGITADRLLTESVSVMPSADLVILHPLTPDRWMLNFGARRLRASRLAGKPTIPAYADNATDSYDQVIENEQRESLSPLELAMFVQKKLQSGARSSEIARTLGKSRCYLTIGALIDPPAWLLDLYRSGRCRGISELYELRKLHELHPVAVAQWIDGRAHVSRADVQMFKERLAPIGALYRGLWLILRGQRDRRSGVQAWLATRGRVPSPVLIGRLMRCTISTRIQRGQGLGQSQY